jgi:CBS domain-containing protein
MRTVRDVLRAKGYDIYSISPRARVFEALQLMAELNIGALLVIEAGHLVGIISERDYARKVILKGKSSKEIPISEIMTSELIVVRPTNTVEECMELMTDKRVRHLPVFDGDQLVGVISIGDVVKSIIADKELMIEQLTDYITGKYPA